MLLRNRLASLLACTLALVGLGTLSAPAAHAWPSNCQIASQFGLCTGGTGSYRLHVTCLDLYSGTNFYVYGRNWVGKNTASIRFCGAQSLAVATTMWYRSAAAGPLGSGDALCSSNTPKVHRVWACK